jgi:hypothetical protein
LKGAPWLLALVLFAGCGKYRDGYLGADMVVDGGAEHRDGEAEQKPDDDDDNHGGDDREELP